MILLFSYHAQHTFEAAELNFRVYLDSGNKSIQWVQQKTKKKLELKGKKKQNCLIAPITLLKIIPIINKRKQSAFL